MTREGEAMGREEGEVMGREEREVAEEVIVESEKTEARPKRSEVRG